jgi:hypothetical protein
MDNEFPFVLCFCRLLNLPYTFETEGEFVKDSKSFSRPTKTYPTLLTQKFFFLMIDGTQPTILSQYDAFFFGKICFQGGQLRSVMKSLNPLIVSTM